MNVGIDLVSVRRAAFGTVGVVLTTLGLVVLVVPGLASLGPGGTVLDRIEAAETGQVLLVIGALAVGSLLLGARSAPTRSTGDDRLDRRLEQLVGSPPEEVTAGPDQVAAAGLDDEITAAIEHGGQAYQEVAEMLEDTAVAVYADTNQLAEEEAAAAVARGSWTTDPVAAALVAGDDGPAFATKRTLRLLALPASERDERIRRTIAAIERLEQL